MAANVSTRVRDITFDFTGSCNCCRRDPPTTPVYVDSLGVAKRFDRRFEANHDSWGRCKKNIKLHLESVAELEDHDPITFTAKVLDRVQMHEAIQITKSHIHKINQAVQEVLSESSDL